MTAVVGILNKKAVAIAADSAASVNGKIFNKALKIFTISKYHPVAISIFNFDSFLLTPWETIIKLYRKQLGKKKFDTVQLYKEDFLNFLHQRNFFADEEIQKKYINANLFLRAFSNIYQNALNKQTGAEDIVDLINLECDPILINWQNNQNVCNEYQDYTIGDFDNFLEETFNQSIQSFFTNSGINLTADIIFKLKTICFEIIKKREEFTFFTGLIFVGFGETEIFPSLISCNVHFAIQNRLKYYDVDKSNITHEIGSSIHPFAQTDAMNTILTGIAPNLETTYNENFKQYIKKYNQRLINILTPDNPQLAQLIQAIDVDEQCNEFAKKIQEAKTANYIKPLWDAVDNLSKEDLAEMAESLIYLTYLQKRITFAAEDVGGDVDVAIISKGDGFIWIKRKHYFKPELNQHFFDNYFNE